MAAPVPGDDDIEQLFRQLDIDAEQRRRDVAEANGDNPVLASHIIEPAAGLQPEEHKELRCGGGDIILPFGIIVNNRTLHLEDNLKVYTIMTLKTWNAVPVTRIAELRKIDVVADLEREMRARLYVPWQSRKSVLPTTFMSKLVDSGCYSCILSTHAYNTAADAVVLAITVMLRRLTVKDGITATIVMVMDAPRRHKTEDELAEDLVAIRMGVAEAEKQVSIMPEERVRVPEYTQRAKLCNFFIEIMNITPEVEARAIGDVS